MLSNFPEVESTKLWFKPRQPGPATNYSVPSKEKQWDIILGHILPLFNGCQSILPFLLNLNNSKRGVPSILIYWISIFLGWAWLFFFFLLPSSPENFLPEALGGGAGALLLHWGRGCKAASYSAATQHKETQSGSDRETQTAGLGAAENWRDPLGLDLSQPSILRPLARLPSHR